jgi:hypothetical protein
MGDASSRLKVEDVPQLVFSTLVDEFGENQKQKYEGFVATQSLRNLMDYLDTDQLVSVTATADVQDAEESFKGPSPPGSARHCITTQEKLITSVNLMYDYSKHGAFPWADVREFLNLETTPVDDLAVRRATVRVSSKQLETHLREVLSEAIDLHDRKYLKSPFFFTMASRAAEGKKERNLVKEHNDEEFLKRVGYRVLRLKKMHSLRAQQDKADPVMGATPQELENMAFNYTDATTQSFGALYSNLLINKWRSAFSRSIGEKTQMVWTDNGQWVPGHAAEA